MATPSDATIGEMGLNPSFWVQRRMLIQDILNLNYSSISGYNVFLDKSGVAVRRLQVVGVLVDFKEYGQSFRYTVDDGTGTIIGIFWKNHSSSQHMYEDNLIDLGSIVSISGTPEFYKGCLQVVLTTVAEDSIVSEALYWIDCMNYL